MDKSEYEALRVKRDELVVSYEKASGVLKLRVARELEQVRKMLKQAHKEQYERKSKGGTV